MSPGLASHLLRAEAAERRAAHLPYLQLDLLGSPVEAHWMQVLRFRFGNALNTYHILDLVIFEFICKRLLGKLILIRNHANMSDV